MLKEQGAHVVGITPWGAEVKRRLVEREITRTQPYTQAGIIKHLAEKGFEISKSNFSFLLKGVGVSNRTAEIKEINELLGIKISSK